MCRITSDLYCATGCLIFTYWITTPKHSSDILWIGFYHSGLTPTETCSRILLVEVYVLWCRYTTSLSYYSTSTDVYVKFEAGVCKNITRDFSYWMSPVLAPLKRPWFPSPCPDTLSIRWYVWGPQWFIHLGKSQLEHQRCWWGTPYFFPRCLS